MLLMLSASSAVGQNVHLPENFYDPQLLAFQTWQVYVGDKSDPWHPDQRETDNWVDLDTRKGGVTAKHGKVWLRVDFTIGWHYRSRDIGLYLGHVEQAHEIYLNGRLIGGEGAFSPNAVDSAGKPSLTNLPKLGTWYSFMNLSRNNTLVIGIEALTGPIRFNPDLVQIDDTDRLILVARSAETAIKVVEGAAISILMIISLFCAFLFVSGFRGRSNVIFGSFVLLAAILIFADSLLFYDFGLRGPFAERFVILARLLAVILLCHLVHCEIGSKFTAGPNRVELVVLGVITTGVMFSTAVPLWLLDLLSDSISIGLLAWCLWKHRHAFLMHSFEARLMLSLCALILFAIAHQILLVPPYVALNLVQVGYLITAFTFLLLTARRYQDMSRHLSALSGRLVTVRDLERARMARDMHDGLGQGIAAVGLHLKILASGKKGDDFNNLTRSIDDLNLHVGEVIQNLRPSILKRQTLGEAIEKHLERTLTDTGIKYDCAVDKRIEMPFELKEQLFRIYQEALNNAIKHAGCSAISVEMIQIGRKLKLVVLDDGNGFTIEGKRGLGLGLSTMRERASLVNAAYTLDSAVMRGTKVLVEVEMND